MAFTYGFYNSLNGDRKYNAFQMTQMFDGIILDGVFEAIGQHFAVTAAGGMTVNVGTGRAWFNHTWNDNDNVMPITLPLSDLNRSRYDAIVIEVGDPNTDRTNTIKVVSGAAAVNPTKPVLNRGATNNDSQNPNSTTPPPYQHALAYVLVKPGVEAITAADIEIVVGKDETPFVTGPIETRSIEELFNQWDAQFSNWFNNLKAQLTDNVVTNLQSQIDQNREAIEYLNATFQVVEKVKTEIFTSGGTWQNTTGKSLSITALLFGGGGGGSFGRGGGGGYMTKWNGVVSANEKVNITIGLAGSGNNNGGTTSFGTYASASGGNSGINGASGGSGGGGGGNGSYGGGGGGQGASDSAGSGGMYGGGGGGVGGGVKSRNTAHSYLSSGSGASGGTYGGGGGSGGEGMFGGSNVSSGNRGNRGNDGTNTIGNADLEFTGGGYGGSGGSPNYGGTYRHFSAGGGGGGGGYGGSGGTGGEGSNVKTTEANFEVYGGGGGGGGGYGANGGNGNQYNAGGGGGYGGRGGNAGQQGYGYGAGGQGGGGGGGGYGNNVGGETSGTSGMPGICIVRYTVREIQVNG